MISEIEQKISVKIAIILNMKQKIHIKLKKYLIFLCFKYFYIFHSQQSIQQINSFLDPQMLKTQRSISIKKEILTKLSMNDQSTNPVCPIGKHLRDRKNGKIKPSQPILIEEDIKKVRTRITSKNFKQKQYKTEKIIIVKQKDYSMSEVLKSPLYKQLMRKYMETYSNFNTFKGKAQKQIKNLDAKIREESLRTSNLCSKLLQLDRDADQLRDGFYQMKRNNYEMRCELDVRREQLLGQVQWRGLNYRNDEYEEVDLDAMEYEQILQLEQRIGKENVGLTTKNIQKLEINNIQSLKNLNQEPINCCICCSVIQSQQKVIQLDCNHIHHAECIKQWLKIKRFCPLCKEQVRIPDEN